MAKNLSPNNEISLVWLRRDLRLADNPALKAALELGDQIILLYIFSEEDEEKWPIGAASKWWLHHSLLNLHSQISTLGGTLNICSGKSKEIISNLVDHLNIKNIFWNRLYEPHYIQRDKAIKAKFTELGVNCESFNSSLLKEPWEIKTLSGGPYQVFTPFWRNLQKVIKIDELPKTPKSLSSTIKIDTSICKIFQVEDLKLLPKIKWDANFYKLWEPGESGALKACKLFLKEKSNTYQVDRDFPIRSGNSCLSPHLHFGEISPKQIWKLAEQMFSNPKAQTTNVEPFLRQLGWRDFANHLLFHFPHTTHKPLKEKFKNFPWVKNKKNLKKWQKGETGIPIIDAGMRELWQTGIMHNRVRMIVGSILVKNLLIDWQEGAKWFWDTLVDADLANNTMGWQWIAGSGADAAPYFRIFNPVSQSERFDEEGLYIKRWVPELESVPAKWIHAPWEMPVKIQETYEVIIGKDYPRPIVDLKESRQRALDAYFELAK